ncbi:hypothetical protein KI387_023038, partial [Taxus chinensis]
MEPSPSCGTLRLRWISGEVESRGRQKNRGKGNRGKSNDPGRSKSKIKLECWHYGKVGHAKKYCWALRDKKNKEETKEVNAVAGDVCQGVLILSLDNIIESWVLDSGASFHATPHKHYFTDFVQGDFGHVYLGDDEPCRIVGKGCVRVKIQNGNTWILKDVRHVPKLRQRMVPNTPQENGVSERMNMTIIERVRYMRLHVGLPLMFWVEAVSTTVYLINRGPSMALDGGKHEEALSDQLQEQKEESKKEYTVLEDIANNKVSNGPVQVPQTPEVIRSSRVRREPERFTPSLNFLFHTNSGEPEYFKEAVQVDVRKNWEQAMDEEYRSLMENQTWDLLQLPEGKRALQNKDKRLSGTMELMSEAGLKETIIRVGKKLKPPHHSQDVLLKDLEEIENCLAMVEQLDKYMIHSLMFQLIKPKIFWHEDVRVKIMVVTCIVEVKRVTTPNLPYSDDIMRDIFKHMVGSFQGLWNVTSPYYNKRVKILETMAKDNHSENVMVAIQSIMSTVIDEYDNVPQHLLNVLKEELRQEASYISHTLAKGVMNQIKMKTYMTAKSLEKDMGMDSQVCYLLHLLFLMIMDHIDKILSGTMELMSEVGLKKGSSGLGISLSILIIPRLIKPRTFWHEDVRVKIIVITCIAKVIRVIAPNLPYNNDIMRDIFEHMVGIFQGLWNITSPYYSKRVKILETMAKPSLQKKNMGMDPQGMSSLMHNNEIFASNTCTKYEGIEKSDAKVMDYSEFDLANINHEVVDEYAKLGSDLKKDVSNLVDSLVSSHQWKKQYSSIHFGELKAQVVIMKAFQNNGIMWTTYYMTVTWTFDYCVFKGNLVKEMCGMDFVGIACMATNVGASKNNLKEKKGHVIRSSHDPYSMILMAAKEEEQGAAKHGRSDLLNDLVSDKVNLNHLLPIILHANEIRRWHKDTNMDSIIMRVVARLVTHLARTNLLRHEEVDVRLLVIACISEVTRIAALSFSYNDTTMEE